MEWQTTGPARPAWTSRTRTWIARSKQARSSQATADEVRASRQVNEGLLREGLNVGRATDNLLDAARQANLIERIPVLGHVAHVTANFVFHQLQPGFMMQVGRASYARNKARFPELSEQELLRKSARETNEFYGNLGSQGFLKSKTMQDAAKLLLFAPGFAEGRFRSEARGFAQAAKVPVDAARGKGFRVGVAAQAMGGMILASLIGNQIVNLFTRGKTTFQNEEEGHKLDAWIPGGAHGRGFFYSPLSVAAEFSHELAKYIGGGESALDAVAQIAGNKLSGPARALKTLATGKDWKGQPFASTGERVKAAALDLSPLPMQAGAFLTKDPKAALGYSLNHQPGSVEKQAFQSAGLKLEAAQSARSQMYSLAAPFRAKGPSADHGASEYSGLRQSLDNEDRAQTLAETRALLQSGKSLPQIAHALGIRQGGASFEPEYYTGSKATEGKMYASLTAAQKATYQQAQKDRAASARLFSSYVPSLMADPKTRQMVQANAASARAQKAAATKGAPLALPGTPVPRRRIVSGGSKHVSALAAATALP